MIPTTVTLSTIRAVDVVSTCDEFFVVLFNEFIEASPKTHRKKQSI
jgi:hypothetical protein